MMDDDSVYLGVWTNWSRGSILGPTLTISREHGNYVIALTAFFIAFIATRFWRICCLVFHRFYSTTGPSDAAHHQRQIILCNSSSPESGLVSLVNHFWAWRRLGKRRLCELSFLIIFVMLCISGFVVAGSFSSKIATDVGNEVLLRAEDCGFIHLPAAAQNQTPTNSLTYQKINAATNYAEECYSNDQILSVVECKRFIVPKLPTAVVNYTAGCPFEDSICRSNGSNLMLDTGYIDSSEHLGLNTPHSQRFQMRRVLHCAPLRTEGFESTITTSNQSRVVYNYGGTVLGSKDNFITANYTYEVERIRIQYQQNSVSLTGKDFILESTLSLTAQGMPSPGGGFMPRPEIRRSDADIELIFLSGNGVVFNKRTEDDWYRATVPFRPIYYSSAEGYDEGYRPETAASPLACAHQLQWCNPSLPKDQACGPLASEFDSYIAAAPLFNVTEEELAPDRESSHSALGSTLVWGRLMNSYNPCTLYQFLSQARSKALSSEKQVYGSVATGLPDNQWKLDVIKWWNMLLAAQQASYVNTARGPTGPEFDDLRLPPLNKHEETLCASQKILSTEHTSFSLFGLYFTFITGGLIILISYILDPTLACLHKRHHHKSYAHLEWRSNATLQIHRQAEEALGLGTWDNCTGSIPTTKQGDILANLDITNPKHPTLCRPATLALEFQLNDFSQSSDEQDNVHTHGGDQPQEDDDSTQTSSTVQVSDNEYRLVSGNEAPVSRSHSEADIAEPPARISAEAPMNLAEAHEGQQHTSASPSPRVTSKPTMQSLQR
ncbi:hypothetical protein F5B21DRAFT_479152 [Xylaria acuta]|nr:hypothetical protein F5B21DRAFT_479152 [Xylaria acuta]